MIKLMEKWATFLMSHSSPGLHKLEFFMHKILYRQKCFRYTSVHVKEQMCMLLITTYCSRNCTKLILKPLVSDSLTASLFQSCALLLSCGLYYFSLHDDHPPFLQLVHNTICLHSSIIILINWNEEWCSKSNKLTMDHELVLENSSLIAVYTLLNTIIYLKAIKYLNIRLRQIH